MEIEPIGPVAMAVYKSVKLKLQFFTEISNRNRIFSGLLLRVFIVLMEVITKRSMADFGGHITHF